MTKTLTGKVALVTGGSRGIGAATARALAAEGADVAISYVTSAEKAEAIARELSESGARAAAFRADQADPAQVEGLIKAVVDRFGRLDVLVNNAAIFVPGTVGGDSVGDIAALDRQLAVNVVGAAAAVRAAARVMGAGGRIISVGAGNTVRVGYPGMADYAATKAALLGYTKGWARDLGPKGITVNIVQAGLVDTDMNRADTEWAAALVPCTALGRYGRPEEIAAAIVFLAGPGASYITGAAIDVDGGFNA